MAAHTRHPEPPFLPAPPPLAKLWGIRVWAAARLLGGLPARVRAWLDRPVTNPRPLLAPAKPAGRHRPGENTVRFAVINGRPDIVHTLRREPRLLGTAPLHEWTHPELYPAVPQRPDGCPLWPCAEATSHFTPDFAQEA